LNIGGGLDKIRSASPDLSGSARPNQAVKPNAELEFSSLVKKDEKTIAPKTEPNKFKPIESTKTDFKSEPKTKDDKFKRFSDDKIEKPLNSSESKSFTSSKDVKGPQALKAPSETPNVPTESGEVSSKIVTVGNDVNTTDTSEKTFHQVGSKKNDELDEADAAPSHAEQQAMLKFMMSMNRELGVKPEEVISAMGSLSDESLLKSPEETMTEVIQKLDLSPKQQGRAVELYQTMLKETAEASMKDWAEKSGKKIDFKLLGPDQIREQKTMAGIDQMNSQFFAQKQQEPEDSDKSKAAVAMFPAAEESKATAAKTGMDLSSAAAKPSVPGPSVPETTAKTYRQAAEQMASQRSTNSPVTESPSTTISPALLASVQGMSEAKNSTDSKPGTDLPADFKEAQVAVAQNPTPDAAAMSAGLGGKSLFASRDRDDESKEGNTGGDSSQMGAVSHSKEKSSLTPENITLAPATQIKVPTADEAANLRTIIQSSRYLVQRGGGEMKVQLQPEGMGNIDLKVAINNGKVDIQMLTESKETKRMLESGMDELRASLIQHKLSLDNVRVDTHNKSGTESNNNNNFFNQEREQARDFLNQFRDSNGSQRTFDNIDLKSYNPQARRLQPDVSTQGQRAKSSTKRLDLVA